MDGWIDGFSAVSENYDFSVFSLELLVKQTEPYSGKLEIAEVVSFLKYSTEKKVSGLTVYYLADSARERDG